MKLSYSSLSEHLWGFSWKNKFLEIHHLSNTKLRMITGDEFKTLVDLGLIKLTGSGNLFSNKNTFEIKQNKSIELNRKLKYFEAACDIFLLEDNRQAVQGVFIGNVYDWDSYYFRYIYVNEPNRGRGLCQWTSKVVLKILLEACVQRIECDVSAGNQIQLERMMKLGFQITGQKDSDRWGKIINLTCFNKGIEEKFFKEHLCLGQLKKIS